MNTQITKAFLGYDTVNRFQDYFLPQSTQFQQLMMMYNCAIKEVKTKLDILNEELSITTKRTPIEFITYRIKKPESIANKLEKLGYPITVDSIVENLNDVAGVRVICPFIGDIYDVAKMLTAQDDIFLITEKDYIKHPKPNGYRSLHLIIETPVFFSNHKRMMRVEVQIRTIAMDFWASLDSQLKYKKELQNAEEVGLELKECADIISQTDVRMQEIKERIYSDI
ncbi:GTP pyrophosphokinase [Clostridium aminobutyricum]|uniref:GTP pyrophosphokinase family protein n=1 Tax=Clostridium aminobutyricum TaxID=33953 RepID=A0A939IKD3_CLOAM|nr:GTP pyrophosphokinase family protein [Clostridium aminobutyricum]MBN7774523.1 GTP pyrophosphokinase family protein [Clostridium aminobutyricum]